jgi:hypothetical protein
MRVGDELWLGSFNADRLAYRTLSGSGNFNGGHAAVEHEIEQRSA